LFLILIGLGPIVRISSSRWIICWVGLELTFLGLIPLLVSSGGRVFNLGKECAIKYFCIQALGSGLLLIRGVLVFRMVRSFGILSYFLFLFRLLIKLGVFPIHFWVPSVVSGLEIFPSILIILTWQKILPLILLNNLTRSCNFLTDYIIVLGGLRAVVGALIGINQTQILPILGASSVTHRGWMILGAVYGGVWLYFFLYCLSLIALCLSLKYGRDSVRGLVILSLRGLPPFLIFIGKWSVLRFCLGVRSRLWYLILPLIGSILSLFFYLKFFYSFYLREGFSSRKKVGFTLFRVLAGLLFIVILS